MKLRYPKKALIIVALLIAGSVLVLMFSSWHRKTESGQRQLQKTESGGKMHAVGEGVSLSGVDQNTAGIVVSSLEPVSHQEELHAYGTVLQPKALVDVRNGYVEAKASVDRALAASSASRQEYERLKKLNEDNKNISDKALQSAGAVSSADEANAFASRERLQSVRDTAALQWGHTIAAWIFDASPAFRRLTAMKDVLVQITLPMDVHIGSAPATVGIQSAGTTPVTARLIAPAPIADPRTQGMSYFYAAPSHNARLIPGMNVQALLPVGSELKGVIIPFPSIVWLHGKAWAYCKTGRGHFVRREVSTLNPVRNGYFVSENFSPGDEVVAKGAQILLSEEVLKLQPGGLGKKEEGDED